MESKLKILEAAGWVDEQKQVSNCQQIWQSSDGNLKDN